MAEGAVGFALKKVDLLLDRERKLLSEIGREVKDIKDEMESMQAFLKDADKREETDQGVKVWVKQVREIAHDTEDVIDEFMFRLAQKHHHQHGFLGFLHKTYHSLATVRDKHRIATEIHDIKDRVQKASERSQRYRFQTCRSFSSPTWHDPRVDALLLIEEADLVGTDRPKEDLIQVLLKEDSRLGVVSVVGMGGLGKTTLVKKAYDDDRVKRKFQHHAWITVSHSPMKDVLREVIALLFKEIKQPIPQEVTTMKGADLKVTLREFLQNKRYVIVFDDIWKRDAWDAIKVALPDSNCRSRIMLTTRLVDLDASSSFYRYNLQPLSPEESWTLFCKRTFQENTCPPHLEEISRSILRRCQGLPLAIVAIGGVLSTKETTRMDEWELVHRSLGSELESNDILKSMNRILSLSYIDLPFHLKHCFLYFSLFPEDYLVKCSRLVKLWIAEGFIEDKEGKTPEEVAESYLYELINRSLLQIGEITRDGRVGSCRVHDITHEIILSRSRDEKFGAAISGEQSNVLQSLQEKFRRLSIYKSLENFQKYKYLSNLRSLFLFGLDSSTTQLKSSAFLHPLFDGFKLLKVLDLRGAPLTAFPNNIVNLFNLRYLSLRETKIEKIPNSIGKLQSLKTLDLKNTCITKLPAEIEKLQQLRHLAVTQNNSSGMRYGQFDAPTGVKVQVKRVCDLGALQKLYHIDVSQESFILEELGRLSQLRKLGISRLRREDGINLCYSIEKMRNLRTLHVASINERELLHLDSSSLEPPPLLQRLFITGCLGEKLPKWIPSLHNLTAIGLIWSELSGDDDFLQSLPNLVTLFLHRAYRGRSLTFRSKGFQRLKILHLIELIQLRSLKVEEGTMPNLKELYIEYCMNLRVPDGIKHLKNLTELTFVNMSDEFGTTLMTNDEVNDYYYQQVAHIPNIKFFHRTYQRYEQYAPR